jgi:hypothetical protein
MLFHVGHGSVIGSNTGQVMGYGVRCKSCRICDSAFTKGETPRQHDCRMNWHGSSKAMEPDIAVSVLRDLKEQDIAITNLVMDDDTTTISRVHKFVDEDIIKLSDSNHVKKALGNKLYSLRASNKTLSGKVIKHIQKLFTYVVSQNKGNVDAIAAGMKAITPHVFGTHCGCTSSWCGFKKSPDTYKPKSLPHGRYLSGESLRLGLSSVFHAYALQADKLSKLSSSQANEAFNYIVATKAPKSKYYSGSESLSFRVGAAVCQKNVGNGYVTLVRDKFTPGFY